MMAFCCLFTVHSPLKHMLQKVLDFVHSYELHKAVRRIHIWPFTQPSDIAQANLHNKIDFPLINV